MPGESHCTTCPIPAHALASVCIEIDHFEIIAFSPLNQNQSVRTNAKPPVAKLRHQGKISLIKNRCTIINHDKIVARPLVFIKFQIHSVSLFVQGVGDRKSTRLNSSHVKISYAVFCLKKKIHSARPLSSHILG